MINIDLEKQINDQIKITIQEYLNGDALRQSIQEKIDVAIADIISSVANKIYADIASSDDIKNHILGIVKLETNQNIQTESQYIVKQELSRVPVQEIVENIVKNEVTVKFDSLDFPDSSIPLKSIAFSPGSLSGDYVSGGLIKNFGSTGIDDKSNNVQLTILDDHVVVENQFTAMNITAADTLTAKNLTLTGTLEIGTDILDHGPFSQMIQMHSQMIVDQALESFQVLFKDGNPLVSTDTLAPSVSISNLRKLGNLIELNVMGDANFGETLYVGSKRIGINTDEPRGALTIRDEETELSFSKSGSRTMYVGSSTRGQSLELGTNNQSRITLKDDIVEVKNPVRVMGIKFSVSGTIPDTAGEPNEIVFVLSANADQPRFYICLGGNQWQAL
jgi:hypothetical protein